MHLLSQLLHGGAGKRVEHNGYVFIPPYPPPHTFHGGWLHDTSTLSSHSLLHPSSHTFQVRKNEELLISGGYDGYVCLWDIRSTRGRQPPHMVGGV